ncbi:MAG: hypothetical protein MUF66_02645, partial [Gammaproteobacteria bacterium]|nr:hypothetical protein [Gammaproteobacteria bacterium]
LKTLVLPLLFASILAGSGAVLADTAEATCELRKDGETKQGASGPCTFSQRQGFVSIELRNGERFELTPSGNSPDRYRDQKGKSVVLNVKGSANEYTWEGGKKLVVRFAAATQSSSGGGGVGDPVSGLQDLVGERGRDGEGTLQERGYTWIRTEKSGDASFAYWRESRNGQCIVVKTADGRYESIVYGTEAGCKGGGGSGASAEERREEFKTVCGVIVNGVNNRYRCTVADFYSGDQKNRSILTYPDMKVELTWRTGGRVGLQFEGMKPQEARYSTPEGETNFMYEGKTYFYYSNKDLARREYDNFRD